MTNHERVLTRAAGLTASAVVGLILVGCGGEEEAAAPPPRPVQTAVAPAPPPPAVTPIEQLMAEYRIDERIVLPEDLAPDNNADRIAVLEFFDSFARGDATELGGMLPLIDRIELEALDKSGAWSSTVGSIQEISIQTGQGSFGDKLALAVFEVEDGFQPQLWSYTADADGAVFEAQPTPPGIIDQLSGDDWIARWIEINEEEMRLANKPDETFEIEPVEINNTASAGGTSSGGGPGGTKPGGAPGPGRRKPPKAPRKPPGPG
jgi:hypothetical protein